MDKALPAQLNEFVDEAKYHQIVKDMLVKAKSLGATQTEVGINASVGLNVTVRKGEVDTLEFNRDKAIGLTVYINQRKGSASTTDLQPASLNATVEAAISLAKLTEEDPFAGLAELSEMARETKTLDLYHPWDLAVTDAIRLAKNCEQAAFAVDKRITNSEGATFSSTQGYRIYANSHGFLGFYPSSRHSLSCVVIAKDKSGMERDYQYSISRKPNNLDPAEKIGKEAAERTLQRLGATKLPTQKAPVLFHASITSGLLSNFVAAISGGRLFRKSTFLLDSLGKQIFPDFIKIDERPFLPGAIGSSTFDGDGVATREQAFVEEGRIKSYILSAYSARKLKLANTGNAGGVHNLFINTGNEDYDGLIKKMDKGLIVMELMGQGINLVTGDYSRGATGFWVENGQIQYPVHEITIAGNLRDMFQHLIAVGKDVDKRGNIQSGSLLIEEMTIAGS
ncbi:MAG: metalloprotease PmbA [Candidatus Berkiellales bacterium]